MGSALYQWLVEAEDSLLRMIRGVFRFVSVGLPQWIYHYVVDTVWPMTIRMMRVMGLAYLWLMILFGPLASDLMFTLPSWWGCCSVAWTGLAITGSIWGLNRAVRKRNAGLSVSVIRERS